MGQQDTVPAIPAQAPGATVPVGVASNQEDQPGTWGANATIGQNDTIPAGPGGGLPPTQQKEQSASGGGVPPTQQKEKPGNWDASLNMNPPEHATGDTNPGGGHTFSRGTTPDELAKANAPVTPGEQEEAKKWISTGKDDYATRENKIRDRMATRRIAEESAGPIAVDPLKTTERVPWDGKYDPTGEGEWIKGVHYDKAEIENRIRTTGGHTWGPLNDPDLLMRRAWQVAIYRGAYKHARTLGLSNAAAHAFAQGQLGEWIDKSVEQFEQSFGTHFAQLGQAISGDPLGNLNKAIEQVGNLVEEAWTNVEKSRELARTIEKQRAQAQEAAEIEQIASGEGNVGAGTPSGRTPDPAAFTKARASIKAQVKDVNFLSKAKPKLVNGKMKPQDVNCVSCSVATDSSLVGEPMGAFPDFDGFNFKKAVEWLSKRFKTAPKYMGSGATGQQRIISEMKSMGEGSRGIVIVHWKGAADSHAFNVVVRDGYVYFPDGQIGDFFPSSLWSETRDTLLFPTSTGR